MKKILLLITAAILACSTAFAEEHVTYNDYDYIRSSSVCISGRLFVITYSGSGYSNARMLSTVQVMEVNGKGQLDSVKCYNPKNQYGR